MIRNEVKIGIAIVMAALIGFIGFSVMRDVPLFRLGTTLYATYAKVDGLTTGSPILLSGIKVGSVRALEILKDDSIRVALSINTVDVPLGSTAYIRATDFLGTKAVVIERGAFTTPIPYNGRIRGVYDEGPLAGLGDLGLELGANVTTGTESLTRILSQVDGLLADGGTDDITAILDNLNRTTSGLKSLLEGEQNRIRNSLSRVESIVARVDRLSAEEEANVKAAIANLRSASEQIDTLVAGLNATNRDLGEILAKINEGQGSLGLLVNDPSLYRNLDSLTYNLNQTVKKLNENPRHYLRHLKLVRLF